MDIWGLTIKGIAVARNPRNPNTPEYKIISFLYKVPRATTEQISEYCDLSVSQTARELKELKGLVARE